MRIHLAAPDILLLYFILGNMSSNPPYFLFYLFYIYFYTFVSFFSSQRAKISILNKCIFSLGL